MSILVEKLNPDQWKYLAPHAHTISFGKAYEEGFDRISFALLVVDSSCGVPMGFITVQELNKNHIYWQHGGAFPGTKNTVFSFRGYEAARDFCAKSYKSVSTFIENDNITMLKFALKLGFKIVGVKHLFDKTCVELLLDLGRV